MELRIDESSTGRNVSAGDMKAGLCSKVSLRIRITPSKSVMQYRRCVKAAGAHTLSAYTRVIRICGS